jgi:phthalate 4,5-cis-dihydrodiol dehydrogenase
MVSCERADVRPLPSGVMVYGDETRIHVPLAAPDVPRFEVIDELYEAVVLGIAPLHDGVWAKATLEICVAMLESGSNDCEVPLVPYLREFEGFLRSLVSSPPLDG